MQNFPPSVAVSFKMYFDLKREGVCVSILTLCQQRARVSQPARADITGLRQKQNKTKKSLNLLPYPPWSADKSNASGCCCTASWEHIPLYFPHTFLLWPLPHTTCYTLGNHSVG